MGLAADLLGTCRTVFDVDPEAEAEDDDDIMELLEGHAQCCETCGWWVEDVDEDGNCEHCSEED